MAKPYNPDDTLIQRYNYTTNRMPTSMTQDNQTYYLHYDQVGTLRLVTDINNNIIKEVTYDTFGNILHDTNINLQMPFGFAGGLHDRDTKFVHFGYREYDPYTGKWTAKDPIGFDGGDANLYGYVLGDPVNFIDPEGLSGAGLPWTKEPPYVTGGKGGNLNPNLPWHSNVNPTGTPKNWNTTAKPINFSNASKLNKQMKKRGWTYEMIQEAMQTKGLTACGNKGPATRYVHPKTGQSVVVDNKTKEIFHLGGKGYVY